MHKARRWRSGLRGDKRLMSVNECDEIREKRSETAKINSVCLRSNHLMRENFLPVVLITINAAVTRVKCLAIDERCLGYGTETILDS